MGKLTPVAFDIETSGLHDDAEITVAGLSHPAGELLLLNTSRRSVDKHPINTKLTDHSTGQVELTTCDNEYDLLTALRAIAGSRLDEDKHYLTAFNGETWNGGFDLPFVRTRCVEHDIDWPFPEIAYADMMAVVDRFDTNDNRDLVGVYDALFESESCDPFEDSGSAVAAFENGDWESLLLHNLADIQRTREIALLAGRYVPQSDFSMKNLNPPDH